MSQNQRPTYMSVKHTNPNLGISVLSILTALTIRTTVLTALALLFGAVIFAQRIVFPGQDLLVPYLNDPSYVGLENRFNVTGMLQLANSDRRQHSQYLFAQIPFTEKLSFGADYFKDGLEFYSYSTAMLSARVKFDLGGDYSHLRLGFSAGIDSRRQTGFPAQQIPNMETFVPQLNEGDTDFTYRAGINYTYNAFSIGGTYNKLPIQSTLARAGQEDLIGYWIKDGFTAHMRYHFYLSETVRLTPLFRYLSYANDPIYEGAVLVAVGEKVSASISYKNDYSINPALQYNFLDVFQVGYSYEKAIADINFDDVHSLSFTYKFKRDGSEESDWQQNAKANNRKIAAIKTKKEKKDDEEAQEMATEREVAEREAAQKEAAEREAAEKAQAKKEAAEREAAQKTAAEREALVQSAIEDYVDALYEVDPSKIERSVDTSLRKIGYWYDASSEGYKDNLPMTYAQLYDLAGSWNKDGKQANAASPKEILIYEVNDKTATAKLTAVWGIDLFHLAKVDGQWKIMNIIWQSPPKSY